MIGNPNFYSSGDWEKNLKLVLGNGSQLILKMILGNILVPNKYIMAEKARLLEDKEIEAQIMTSSDPKTIKALGKKVKNFYDDLWDNGTQSSN